MSFNNRGGRSSDNHVKLVIDRLYRIAASGTRQTASFTELCDMASIPRDLRAVLLDQMLDQHLVTREGDQIRITSTGTLLAKTVSE